MSGTFITFINCRLCRGGELVDDQMVVSEDTGRILKRTGYIGGEAVDLEGRIIAPGFIDIQTNGLLGFHFTHFTSSDRYAAELQRVAQFLPSTGVTAFYPTVPTCSSSHFKTVLPQLAPQEFPQGASILGAHVEGPYLHPDKKGAHDASLFRAPSDVPPTTMYGEGNLNRSIKIVTIAPEIDGAVQLIQDLQRYAELRVSLGHSTATYDQGLAALSRGATCLTHTLNAMPAFHSRDPTLAQLIVRCQTNSQPPFYSLIVDGNHLHPSTTALLYRANPAKCILITDSVELAGLADGLYPGHAQIPGKQRKAGTRVTLEGSETLVGSCATLDQCVRNLMAAAELDVAAAVRCATENVVAFTGDRDRGILAEGRRADFVVLSDEGEVLETWIAGKKAWSRD